MCVLAAKYFDGIGWAAAKCRDRNYLPTVNFRKSYRNDIERLYIWDETTKYTEGLNENGVCIISAALATKADEKEKAGEDSRNFYSPDGKKIRDALLEPTVKDAVKRIIKSELNGHTFVFDAHNMYIIEGINNAAGTKWFHKVMKLDKNDIAVRTNHGINLPKAGYQREIDEQQTLSRISSESRYLIATKMTMAATSPMDLMNKLCYHENEEPQLNPCRLDNKKSNLRTTGQLMLVPSKQTLYYRPIMCDINFDYFKLNEPNSKTYFELCGMRPLLFGHKDED